MGEHNGPISKEILIFDDGWTKWPAFFVDDLMPIAVGVPASFWKYLLIVWRDCFDQHPGYRCSKTMTQFHMTKGRASKWTAALSVSCIFHVRYGRRHNLNEPGVPTEITYEPDTTREDWLCFIAALRDTLLADKREHNSDIDGFRAQLAVNLHVGRRRIGLSTAMLERYLDSLPEGTVKKVGVEYVLDPKWRDKTDRTGVLDAKGKAYIRGE